MEYTVSSAEKNRIPTAEEKVLLTKLRAMGFTVFLGAPELADVDQVVDDQPIADGVLSLAAQLDVPRNLTYAITDANDSSSGTCVVIGTDMLGRAVTESFTWALTVGKTKTGTVIFAKITSATLSGVTGSAGGATDMINIGCGTVIGIPMDIEDSDEVRHAYLGVARVATPVIATGEHTSGVDVSGSTYDGSKVMFVVIQPTRLVPNPD
jgi:hypothetical protein